MQPAIRVAAVLLALGSCTAIGCQDRTKPVDFPLPVARIELRPAETEPGDGLEETVTSVTGQKLFLHPREKGLVGADDLSKAYVVIHADEGIEVILCTEFTQSGQKKMEQLNQTHRGKPVVVMIDGKARRPSDPRMRQASNVELAIAAVFTREEAQMLRKEARK